MNEDSIIILIVIVSTIVFLILGAIWVYCNPIKPKRKGYYDY